MSILEYTKADVEGIREIALCEIRSWKNNISLFEKLIQYAKTNIIDCKEKAKLCQKNGNMKAFEFLMKECIPQSEHAIQTYRQLSLDCEFYIKKHEERIKEYDSLLAEGNLPLTYSDN